MNVGIGHAIQAGREQIGKRLAGLGVAHKSERRGGVHALAESFILQHWLRTVRAGHRQALAGLCARGEPEIAQDLTEISDSQS